jgi:acyl carrier protein
MSEQEILTQIESILSEVASMKGMDVPKIEPSTQLLDGSVPIDSLDLAVLVRELEEFTGYDPFRNGFINFRTAGELARLYQQ